MRWPRVDLSAVGDNTVLPAAWEADVLLCDGDMFEYVERRSGYEDARRQYCLEMMVNGQTTYELLYLSLSSEVSVMTSGALLRLPDMPSSACHTVSSRVSIRRIGRLSSEQSGASGIFL